MYYKINTCFNLPCVYLINFFVFIHVLIAQLITPFTRAITLKEEADALLPFLFIQLSHSHDCHI